MKNEIKLLYVFKGIDIKDVLLEINLGTPLLVSKRKLDFYNDLLPLMARFVNTKLYDMGIDNIYIPKGFYRW